MHNLLYKLTITSVIFLHRNKVAPIQNYSNYGTDKAHIYRIGFSWWFCGCWSFSCWYVVCINAPGVIHIVYCCHDKGLCGVFFFICPIRLKSCKIVNIRPLQGDVWKEWSTCRTMTCLLRSEALSAFTQVYRLS